MAIERSTPQTSQSFIGANLNPLQVIKNKIVTNITKQQIQQVGLDLRIAEDLTLPPGMFANIPVMECFDMQNYFGVVTIRSSLSRLGIFCTSGIYDPGFKGSGGVSLYNFGSEIRIFFKGDRIAQIVIFPADSASAYNGHYNKTKSIKSQHSNKE